MSQSISSITEGSIATAAALSTSQPSTSHFPDTGGEAPRRKNKKKKNKKRNAPANNGQQPGGSAPPPTNAPVHPTQRPTAPFQKVKPAQPQSKHNTTTRTTPNTVASPMARPPREFQKFRDLPPELQKYVFEIAYCSAKTQYRGSLDWIYGISRDVKEWLEPFIYDFIVLPCDYEYRANRVLPLYERTFQSRPKEFYTKTVKRVYTNNQADHENSDFELQLLPVCDNLDTLECWSDPKETLTKILTTKYWPKLQTLCLNIDLLPKDENTFHLPIFKHVTHLDLTSEEPQLPSWDSLKSLDSLTHMRVYMLVSVKQGEFRKAMDLVYPIAMEAQKCLPGNLKHFVILVPMDLLYYISFMKCSTAKDKQRWDRMESIRIGTFDPRIMLGSSGDWDTWLDDNISDYTEEGEESLLKYCQFIPQLTYPSWPRAYLAEEEEDTWEEVIRKDRKRAHFLASRRK
ncbi:hypothetical protein NP233_g7848 [Leucocoprinus birnbaumii]|uniref:Uncharacterized protein n=1 Tax=Leucocoprinus birnbaumii TaxID=56174 RepID=A0AAD5VQ26_9AGAR|nr:hypothetical protein NP233_g7848 [Leucocoprinus birnbaumii]